MNSETAEGGGGATTAATKRAVMAVVGLGTALGALSGSTVMLALPRLGEVLHLDVGQSGWVISSFLIVMTVLLLPAGRVSDMIGHRTMYLVGFSLFGLASILCGLAVSFVTIFAARVLQAVGAAMLVAPGPALLTTTFPAGERGRALGMLSTATYVGLTIGPFVGGTVLHALGWRWIFFMNVPIAVTVVVAGLVFLPAEQRKVQRHRRFDVPGLVTLSLGLPPLVVAISQGTDWGWGSAIILGCAAGGILFLAAFLVIEARSPHPLIDLALFRSRTFAFAYASATSIYTALFVPIFLLPFYLTESLGLEPFTAGIVLTAQPLAMAVVATPSGRISDRVGVRWPATVGMLVMTAGMGLLTLVGPQTPPLVVSGFWAVAGLGTGIFVSPNSSALMGSAPESQQGVAGAVIAVARTFGMLLGVALAIVVFSAAGGRTGEDWSATDHVAMRVAMLVASGIGLAGAAASALQSDRRITPRRRGGFGAAPR